MQRIETDNFILTQNLIESNGDSTWIVKELNTDKIFYIHVFSNNRLNIKIFKHTGYINNPSEAILALCNFLVTKTNITPSIRITYKNQALISICIKAGFRKKEKIKDLYVFEVTK